MHAMVELLGLLLPLLRRLDAPLAAHLEAAGLGEGPPIFALAWLLTWFAHGVPALPAAARLFDAFLAAHPLLPLYAAAAAMKARARPAMRPRSGAATLGRARACGARVAQHAPLPLHAAWAAGETGRVALLRRHCHLATDTASAPGAACGPIRFCEVIRRRVMAALSRCGAYLSLQLPFSKLQAHSTTNSRCNKFQQHGAPSSSGGWKGGKSCTRQADSGCRQHVSEMTYHAARQAARKQLLAEEDGAELHRALTGLDVLGAVGGPDELARRAAHHLHACPPQALLRAERMRLAWCGRGCRAS